MTDFARYLQAQMDERGWNRSQLAKAAGFNRGVVTEYLNNGVIPGAENRQRIARALGVPLADVNKAADNSPTHGVFELSPERLADAQTLNRSQAELVYEIIRHLAEGNRRRDPHPTLDETAGGLEGTRRWMQRTGQLDEEVTGDDDPAPNKRAAGSAATDELHAKRVTRKYTPPWEDSEDEELDVAAERGHGPIEPDEDMPQ